MDALWTALDKGRNDLEDAACLTAPIISSVLAVLGAARGWNSRACQGREPHVSRYFLLAPPLRARRRLFAPIILRGG